MLRYAALHIEPSWITLEHVCFLDRSRFGTMVLAAIIRSSILPLPRS
jgi:hypothetical protein